MSVEHVGIMEFKKQLNFHCRVKLHIFSKYINSTLLFVKSNKHGSKDLHQNTTESTQEMYLELHTWYPYENSDRCNPTEGTVPVKVFKVRHLSDIRRSDLFR